MEKKLINQTIKVLGVIWVFLAALTLIFDGLTQTVSSIGLIFTSVIIVVLFIINLIQKNKGK